MKRWLVLLIVVLVLAGCSSPPSSVELAGSSGGSAAPPATGGVVAPAPSTAVALVATEDGTMAVDPASGAMRWNADEAVSAPDGSAIFQTRHDVVAAGASAGIGHTRGDGGLTWTRLVQLDPRTGTEHGSWNVPGRLAVAAVAPDGRWVALTEHDVDQDRTGVERPRTDVVVFDPTTGNVVKVLPLSGDVEPEAFSIDGSTIFALHVVGDHYRVESIVVATGERHETFSREKAPPEDMYGTAIQAVLSTDHTLLATLYRQPGNADEPAFVHVLDLQNGWSHCADLPAPFGTGGRGTDLLSLSSSGALEVRDAAGSTAEIDIAAVHEPDPSIKVGVAIREQPGVTAVPEPVRRLPQFRRLVTILP